MRRPSVRITTAAISGTRPFELPRPHFRATVRLVHCDHNFGARVGATHQTITARRQAKKPSVSGVMSGNERCVARPFELPRPQFPAPVRLPGRRGETVVQGAVHRDGCLHSLPATSGSGIHATLNMEMRPADVGGRASPARWVRTCSPPTNGIDPGYSFTTSPTGPGARCRRNLLRQSSDSLRP